MATQSKPEASTQIAPATPSGPGMVARTEFGATQIDVSGETAGTALAAQARAIVEARFIMALRRPRDWDDVRSRLLRACERPGFAGHATEKVWGAAWYRKPIGDGVEGFSIRFAEEAIRCMGNIDVQTVPVFEDDHKRLITVTVTDLEANIAFPTSIAIEKTVERRFLRKGEEAMRVRIGSRNEPVYIVPATDDEVFSKAQNLASKAIRNGALRILPGDIQAECRKRILEIRLGDAAKDPDKVRKEVADGFAALNVLPSHLKDYLGHDLGQATPAELADLRELWQSIKAGKTTWAAVMAEEVAERGEAPPPEPEKKPGLEGVTEKLKAEAEKAKPGQTTLPR